MKLIDFLDKYIFKTDEDEEEEENDSSRRKDKRQS